MKRRPWTVTVIGLLYIAAGAAGIVYHAPELKDIATQPQIAGVLLLRILAIVGGVWLLRRAGWARWLLVLWIAFHAALSIFHSPAELVTHVIFLGLTAWALFYRGARTYFAH